MLCNQMTFPPPGTKARGGGRGAGGGEVGRVVLAVSYFLGLDYSCRAPRPGFRISLRTTRISQQAQTDVRKQPDPGNTLTARVGFFSQPFTGSFFRWSTGFGSQSFSCGPLTCALLTLRFFFLFTFQGCNCCKRLAFFVYTSKRKKNKVKTHKKKARQGCSIDSSRWKLVLRIWLRDCCRT